MKQTVRFLIENAKSIIFLSGCFLGLCSFVVVLYGVPSRLEKCEKDIIEMSNRQTRLEAKLSSIEESFKEVKEDLKEIRNDVKLLLRVK